jgi:hypothetical protein
MFIDWRSSLVKANFALSGAVKRAVLNCRLRPEGEVSHR